jgi:hypothetical protein
MTSAPSATQPLSRRRRRTGSTRARRTPTRPQTPVRLSFPVSLPLSHTYFGSKIPSHYTLSRLIKHGKANSLIEDERSIKNKLEREEKRENEDEEVSVQEQRRQQDATLPARAHGNEPSKGAKIDQELREEEEAELKRKGKA